MIVRNPSRRRGDLILALDNRKIGLVVAGAVSLFLVFFVLGFFAGRLTTGSAEYVGRTLEEPGLASPDRADMAAEPDASADPAPGEEGASPVPEATPAAPPAPAAAERGEPPVSQEPTGRRYAIVAASFPLSGDTAAVMADAERQKERLRVRGFRGARIETITIPERGTYLRIIAMEANYPSSSAAQRDIQAMIRRGDLAQGFALPLGPAR